MHTDTDSRPDDNTSVPTYNTQVQLTYLFYDTKFHKLLHDVLHITVPDGDDTAEFTDDPDILGYLYSNELRHIFGNTAADGERTTIADDVWSTEQCETLFQLVAACPQLSECIDSLTTKSSLASMLFIGLTPASESNINNNNQADRLAEKRRHVFPILFSYDLLFFTHLCVCDLLHNSYVVTPDHLRALRDAIREFI